MAEPTNARRRVSREEQRQITIDRLADAGVQLFAEQGIAETSIEQITEAAGYSRGAFYSNFADKDAFVQSLIERSHQEQNRDNAALLNESSPTEFVERLAERSRTPSSVGIEYVLYAIRNPERREALRSLTDATLAEHAAILSTQFERLDMQPPVSPDAGARILLALDHGFGILGLLDTEGFPPGLWGETVEFLNEAAVALAEKRERQAGQSLS